MSLKGVLFHTTFLSGLVLGTASALADLDNIYVNDGEAPVITTPRNVGDAWVGISNPDQYLEVDGDDGWIISTNAAIGLDATSDDNDVVVTNGGRWDQNGGFIVGLDGSDNSLFIEEGGLVTATTAAIGVNAGADFSADRNQVVVDGLNGESRFDVTGEVTVGDKGLYNTMSVVNGGKTTNSFATIGKDADSGYNSVTVQGAGSEWKTTFGTPGTGILNVGSSGSYNELNVLEGGKAIIDKNLVLGENAGSNGNALTVDGADSTVTVGDVLYVGSAGSDNEMTLSNGGTVTVAADMLLAGSAGSSGNSVDIAGESSKLTVTNTLYVGRSGSGNSLLVTDKGTLETGAARIGGGTGSEAEGSGNTVTVRGAGSTWLSSGSLRIGDGRVHAASDNRLIIEDGGTVSLFNADPLVSTTTFIGREAGDSGNQLIVRGTGSSFTSNGDIDVGKRSDSIASALFVDDGGLVSARDIGVGSKSGIIVGSGASLEARNLDLSNAMVLAVALDADRPPSITVDETALLGGTLGGIIGPGGVTTNRYEVLSAAMVSGTFTSLSLLGGTANYAASIEYTATDVSILFTADLGNGEKLDGNQQNVANALDHYFNNGGTLTPEIASLYGLTGGALETALTEVSGEVGASGGVNAITRATTSFLNLLTGGGGQSAAPTSGRQAAATVNTGIVPTADVPPATGGWSVWGGVYGGVADISGNSSRGSHDTDTNVGGIATGWDYDVSPDTRVGLAIAGGQTNWDLDSNLGSGDSTFFQLGGYGTQHIGASYLSLAAAYAWHSMSTNRQVTVDGTEKLDADFDASNLAGRIEAGHRFEAGQQLGVTPYAAFQAQAVYMPGYKEGGGAFALDYNSETATALRSELGIGLDLGLGADPSLARIFGRAAWAHDWNSDASVQASFASLDMSTFTVNGAEMPDNIALLTAGAAFGLSDATELAATFDGEFGDGYQSYAGSVKLTYSW